MVNEYWGFPGGTAVKNPPAIAGGAGDMGLIPKLGRSLMEAMATHSSILAGIILWTEEPGGLRSIGCKVLDTTKGLNKQASDLTKRSGVSSLIRAGVGTSLPFQWLRIPLPMQGMKVQTPVKALRSYMLQGS